MGKITLLCLLLLIAQAIVAQITNATAYRLIEGRLLKGKWQYSAGQKVNKVIEFAAKSITIKDSIGTEKYRILNDVVTKRKDEDSCITSLRTGYDANNIRCMINVVEFFNGVNVLNVLYNNLSYSYYFKYDQD